MKTLSVALFALFLSTGSIALGQSTDPRVVLAEADQAFQDAVALSSQSPDDAERAFALSAAHYQALVDDHGVETASVFLNLGNARLLSGDTGRAILNYRRAQRLAPSDPDIETALTLARSAVSVSIQASLPDRSVSALSKGLNAIGRPVILIIALVCWIAAWGVCAINRSGVAHIRLIPVPALFAIAGVGAGVLVFEQAFETHARRGVVVWEAVDGRSGPGIGVYDESFDRPLPAGLELTIVSDRVGWIEAQLPDGRVTWLPKDSVEEI